VSGSTGLEDVFAYVDEGSDEYVETLRRLCRQPSVSAQDLGVDETAEMVASEMRRVGGDVRLIPTAGKPVVFAVFQGRGERTLSFYNHYDVQPPEPLELWDSPPFAPEVRDGCLYARGAADNKGNLVARIAAVEAFLKTRGELPLSVKFIVEGEEETGSPHLPQFAEEHAELLGSDGCIWESGGKDPRGRPEVYLGMKGICYVELSASGAKRDLHSAWGTVVPNPAWRLVHALSTLKDRDETILIKGFYDNVRDPTERDLEALRRMDLDIDGWREKFGLNQFLNNLSGTDFLVKHFFQPTCTICGITSGYTGAGSKTVLPSQAMAKVDFRLVPDQDPEDVPRLLRSHLDSRGFQDVKVLVSEGEHPARSPLESPIAEVAVSTARRIYGMEPVVYPMMAGSGPMYVLCQKLGIPAASVGVSHADSRAHAPNENIRLDDFVDGIKHIALIMHELSKTRPLEKPSSAG